MFWPRTDKNQKHIVKALRKLGASVHCTHMVGNGFPDLVVGYGGKNYLVEVKSEKGRLNKKQKEFFDKWLGNAIVLRSIKSANKWLKQIIGNSWPFKPDFSSLLKEKYKPDNSPITKAIK